MSPTVPGFIDYDKRVLIAARKLITSKATFKAFFIFIHKPWSHFGFLNGKACIADLLCENAALMRGGKQFPQSPSQDGLSFYGGELPSIT